MFNTSNMNFFFKTIRLESALSFLREHMVGVMVSAGGSRSVVALSAKTYLLPTWWLSRRGRMIFPGWPTLRSPGWGDPRGHPRSGSSSTFPRMTMYASMSTHTAGHSLPRTVSDSLYCHFAPLYLFGLLCIWMPVGLIAVQFSLESRCIIYVSPARPSLRSYVGWTCILTPVCHRC